MPELTHADPKTTERNAGTFTTAISTPVRSEWCCGFTIMPDGLVNTIAAT
jgi:hypothetical protein